MPSRANIISLGSSLRLYSLGTLLEAFAPAGMTRRGLSRLLTVLDVPYIEIGETRYVHLLQFQIALYAVLRIGRPPFIAPGAKTTNERLRRRCHTTSKGRPISKADMADLVAELLYAKKLAAGLALSRKQIRRDAITIADVLAAQVPSGATARALAEFTSRAHRSDPTIAQSTEDPPSPLEGVSVCLPTTPTHLRKTTRSKTPSTPSSVPTDSVPPAD